MSDRIGPISTDLHHRRILPSTLEGLVDSIKNQFDPPIKISRDKKSIILSQFDGKYSLWTPGPKFLAYLKTKPKVCEDFLKKYVPILKKTTAAANMQLKNLHAAYKSVDLQIEGKACEIKKMTATLEDDSVIAVSHKTSIIGKEKLVVEVVPQAEVRRENTFAATVVKEFEESEKRKLLPREKWRYNSKRVAKILLKKFPYNSNKEIHDAVTYLWRRGDDIRFNNKKRDSFTFDPTELLGHIKNLHRYCPYKKKKTIPHNKLRKKIREQLVGLVTRKDVGTSFTTSVGRKKIEHTVRQTMGHVTQRSGSLPEFHKGTTISAELPKKEINVLETANNGFIVMDDEVILSRSARTDTAEKIDRKSCSDILARLNTEEKKGLIEIEDGVYSYTRMDITFMDKSWLKSVGTTAQSYWKSIKSWKKKPVEDERSFLKNKSEAIDRLWRDDNTIKDANGRRYIERTFSTDESTEGRTTTVTVREYKPVLMNFVFSKQGNPLGRKYSRQIRQARFANVPSNLRLLEKIIAKLKLPEDTLNPIRYLIDAVRDETNADNLALLGETLKNALQVRGIDENVKSALGCLYKSFVGEDDLPKDSAIDFLSACFLADTTGCCVSLECKSGNDRTATGVALRCAQKEMEIKKGKKNFRDKGDTKEFKEMFVKYIKCFGKSVVQASRGGHIPILKTKTSPVFRLFADQQDLDGVVKLT